MIPSRLFYWETRYCILSLCGESHSLERVMHFFASQTPFFPCFIAVWTGADDAEASSSTGHQEKTREKQV